MIAMLFESHFLDLFSFSAVRADPGLIERGTIE
jgi:hypothetical protein